MTSLPALMVCDHCCKRHWCHNLKKKILERLHHLLVKLLRNVSISAGNYFHDQYVSPAQSSFTALASPWSW